MRKSDKKLAREMKNTSKRSASPAEKLGKLNARRSTRSIERNAGEIIGNFAIDLFAVPWEAGADAIVTASMSLSPRDGGKKAPAAVVGFQMPMTGLYRRFIALTSPVTPNPDPSQMDCSHNWIDCYLLDQNGYVVLSEAYNDSGQFMGTQEGAIMRSMVNQGLYNPVEIYDYQAWCQEVVSVRYRGPIRDFRESKVRAELNFVINYSFKV